MRTLVSLILLCGFSTSAIAVERIAFGACNFQLLNQKYWNDIAKQNPDVWIWMGDNIYADYLKPKSREREYIRQRNAPGYKEFREEVEILGTWDDHDYGFDGAGVDYKNKKISQKLALDFFGEPANSPRRKQEGIYAARTLGGPDAQVKVLLLDVRYFRQKPGTNAELLGTAQWKWLEQEMGSGSEALRVIVSGSQIIPQEVGGDFWQAYPSERQRLLQLAARSPVPTVFLSGDVHFSEISQIQVGGTTLVEHTSSGLTHGQTAESIPNKFRVGKALLTRNFGMMELNWTKNSLDVDFQIRDIDGSTFDSHRVRYARNPSHALWNVSGWF